MNLMETLEPRDTAEILSRSKVTFRRKLLSNHKEMALDKEEKIHERRMCILDWLRRNATTRADAVTKRILCGSFAYDTLDEDLLKLRKEKLIFSYLARTDGKRRNFYWAVI